eukprot:GHVP01009888.1.p1 GENE.GHVP01009888.1~~GHVP01009888.1.p1  ORF type:complete len:100 (-),score=10.54 GHVP01009888.1:9-308(-)
MKGDYGQTYKLPFIKNEVRPEDANGIHVTFSWCRCGMNDGCTVQQPNCGYAEYDGERKGAWDIQQFLSQLGIIVENFGIIRNRGFKKFEIREAKCPSDV